MPGEQAGEKSMQQLGALDNLMIDGEVPNIPMHMSAILIYDAGGKRGSARLFETFSSEFQQIVDEHFPILRCRVERLPLHLDRAYWVEDPNFSQTYHVRRVALPKGKGWQELYRMFGQFHAQPLDTARPLWEVMYVEGLDGLDGIPRGAAALFLKIHHAVLDGKGALRLVRSFHSSDPEPGSPLLAESMPPIDPAESDFGPPSLVAKYGRAWWHSIERPIDLTATLVKMIPAMLQFDGQGEKQKPHPVPHTHFNHPITADRVVGHVRMAMDELRRLEKKHRCTINDIALCVIAGALRDYLSENHELPDEDLCTMMPIDIRRPTEEGAMGNHVTMAKISMYTSMGDARKRLRAIHKESSLGKKRSKKRSSLAMLDLVDEIHPAVLMWLGNWLVSSGRIDELPQTTNTVVTNVPGIRGDAYIDGVKLIDYLGFGPLAPNMGLFHTVSSTPEQVNISFLSTAEFVADGAQYRVSLEQSWAEVSAL